MRINDERIEGGIEVNAIMLLAESMLNSFRMCTVHNFMRQIGFKYKVRKKTHNVDSHEKTKNAMYRANFIERYFGHDLRSCR